VKQGNRLSVMPVEEAVAKNFRYGWDGAEEYLRSNGNYFLVRARAGLGGALLTRRLECGKRTQNYLDEQERYGMAFQT